MKNLEKTKEDLQARLDRLRGDEKDELDGGFRKGGLKDQALRRGAEVVCGCAQTLNSHNHTFYSVLDGISSPESMVDMTARRGFGGIGISDHGTMGGNLRAGRAGKDWKTGRRQDGTLFNYKKVTLSDYLKQFRFAGSSELSHDELLAAVEMIAKKTVFVTDGEVLAASLRTCPWTDPTPIKFNDVDEIIATDMPAIVYFSNGEQRELSQDAINIALKPSHFITHVPDDPSSFQILTEDEFQHVGDFKVLSGCEFYVSWEDQRHKKYNHISVYATGERGHRALVLLTSIGSVPSRRFVGARGFFRPRVFIEDIDLAIKESGGELVVTTGCPISITSEAFRAGDDQAARRFFDWGVSALAPGRFFAELHLCDVSLDFNRLYAQGEDRFFASVLGTPVSRFRIEDRVNAQRFAEEFYQNMSLFTLGQSLVVDHSVAKTVLDGFSYDDFVEGSEEQAKYAKFGRRAALSEAGISITRDKLFSKSQIDKLTELAEAVSKRSSKLIEESVAHLSDETSQKKKGRRGVVLLDEDTLTLLSYATQILDQESSNDVQFQCARLIANLVAFTVTEIAKTESVTAVNPNDAVRGFLAAAADASPNAQDAESIRAISEDRVLLLDCFRDVPEDIMAGAARAIVNVLKDRTLLQDDLAPRSGPEDDRENEWISHPEGNWMEKVNRSLVAMAKEYDVPLLLATDAHMTEPDLKPVQDAVIKRGKRRAWHMSRPYAIPRSDFIGYLDDIGRDYHEAFPYLEQQGNAAYRMIAKDILSFEDLVEAFGAGSMLLDEVSSAANLKWQTVVPRIKYERHPMYEAAKARMEDGRLKKMLFDDNDTEFRFSEETVNISTAILAETFYSAIADGLIPNKPEYFHRFFAELHLLQEAPGMNGVREELSDFFLVLQYVIKKWRDAGISVGPGRGSSGGMLMAMLCGITYGDPITEGFLASRWMNGGRKGKGAHADMDVDVDDRQLAGKILAEVARESMEQSVRERALSPLEEILHAELFFSSNPVTHQEVGGMLQEVKRADRDLKAGFENAMKKKTATTTVDSDNEVDSDALEAITPPSDDSDIVTDTPIIRVGTYGSLKAKAAVKEAIRIADRTPFIDLPSFGDPPPSWRQEHQERLASLPDEESINRLYEDEKFGHLSQKERTARRRVKLGDRLTKAMSAGSGLARLYRSERDFFFGSVYGICPDYWDMAMPPPKGSPEAASYFDKYPDVKSLVLNMLNIYKSLGVHAGGMCFGREVFERVPVRADKHGYVAQLEMGDIETTGILKFDVLGLETLTLISETLKLIVQEKDWETDLKPWLGESAREVYERVKNGESPDYLWRFIPPSTKEAVNSLVKSRAMTFQVDTPVFGRELDAINPDNLMELIHQHGSADDPRNQKLLDTLNALLALFRPGPMKLNSHREYIARMQGADYPTPHPWLAQHVKSTYGLIIYQEQVMAIYRAAAIQFNEDSGEPLKTATGEYVLADEGETDEVRRALGKKKISALREMRAEFKFLRGLKHQGVSDDDAKQIWETIIPFAEYGFNAPHSYHYGLISAITLFLKGNFTEEFFRIGMAIAKPDDAARFLGEIQDVTRPACVLKSDELFWRVVDGSYFPGLLTVENLKRREIEKIMKARDTLKGLGISSPTAVEFFTAMGQLTPAFAKTLSRSGSLRALGDPKQIADAYEQTVIGVFKPQEAEERARKRDLLKEEGSGVVDLLADLDFDPIATKADQQAPKDPVRSNKVKSRKSPPKKRSYKLSKKDQEVAQILADHGITYNVDGFLTVKSAYDLVTSNKTRGSGIKHLHASINSQDGENDKPMLVMIKELKDFCLESGAELAANTKYRFIGIPKAVSSFANARGEAEPSVSFLSEGSVLRAKFSRFMDAEEIDEAVTLLKDGKMATPFCVTVYAGEFTKEGRVIRYFKIEDVDKISL